MSEYRKRRHYFNHVKFGEALMARRIERSLSYREMGKYTGLSHVAIWNAEMDPRPNIGISTILKLCNAYKIDIHDLIEEIS